MSIEKNLASLRSKVAAACERAGRDVSKLTLVAVTKGVSESDIRKAIELGVKDFGENRVQEARDKISNLGRSGACWHLIGHLQSNKVKYAVDMFDMIHSVDSVELLNELERQAEKKAKTVSTFIQVNVSGEDTKFGCGIDEAEYVATSALALENIKLAGLMTIAPFSSDPEDSRAVFRGLRQLRDSLASRLKLPASGLKLSMGMSGDFEVAVEEGADILRIGTAIFGKRKA